MFTDRVGIFARSGNIKYKLRGIFMYTIDQLSGDVKERALENVRYSVEDLFYESELNDFIKSMWAFLQRYNLKLKAYTIELNARSYVNVELGESFYDDIDELYALMRSEYMDEANGACSLTGVHTDALFYDRFRDIGFDVTIDTFVSELTNSVDVAMRNLLIGYELILDTDETLEQHARDEHITFNKKGKIIS